MTIKLNLKNKIYTLQPIILCYIWTYLCILVLRNNNNQLRRYLLIITLKLNRWQSMKQFNTSYYYYYYYILLDIFLYYLYILYLYFILYVTEIFGNLDFQHIFSLLSFIIIIIIYRFYIALFHLSILKDALQRLLLSLCHGSIFRAHNRYPIFTAGVYVILITRNSSFLVVYR